MAMDTYLQLDGVTGEATRANYTGWIELDSFSFGASNPVSIGTGSTGAGAGKASLSSFNVMKRTDSSSPVLFQKCCMGQHFAKALLLRIAECEIKLAVKRVDLFVDTLLGLVRLIDTVRRADFCLRFLDGLEGSRGEKCKNR